jgi:hypothetical protein
MRASAKLLAKRVLREPLLHFALLGALLLGADHLRAPAKPAAENRRIVVSRRQVDELVADFTRRRGHAPTREEESQEVDRWVEEEALFRAALRLGLHESDGIVRRRLVQRMRFLHEDMAPVREPSDDELRTWIAARGETYAPAPRVTFEQAFFSRSRRGEAIERVANEALEGRKRGGEAASDPYPLPLETKGATQTDLAKVLGPGLAEKVFALPAGEWRGPFASSYGLHLVRVHEHTQAAISFDEARKRAREDWLADKRRETERTLLASLRSGFEVVREDGGGP